MTISAQDVKALREQTGAGMMDCKKALQETGGDLEAAVDHLRKAGIAKAAKKSGRIAAEGLVFTKVTADKAVLAEVNCETDFVAKNEDFLNFGNQLAEAIHGSDIQTLEDALKMVCPESNESVEDKVKALIAKIGENITFRRLVVVTPKNSGKIGHYIHMNGKIVVTCETTGNLSDEVIRDVCMQIAAMSPQYVDKADVPESVLVKEKEIFREQLKESGKPDNVIDKILEGKVQKFAGEISLLQQAFVKDSKKTIQAYLKDNDPSATVVQFERVAVGEGVQKKEEDFAAEVAKMTGS